MLASMSTEFGSQPEFRLPGDENILEKAAVHSHCRRVLGSDAMGAGPLRPRLVIGIPRGGTEPEAPRCVLQGKERCGLNGLWVHRCAAIFGDSAVHTNVHYDGAGGHGEIDCLVGGGTPVVVEVKSQSVTDSGRRGGRARLERVAKELLERSVDQTGRASDYINNGGRWFAPSEGSEGRQLLHDEVGDPSRSWSLSKGSIHWQSRCRHGRSLKRPIRLGHRSRGLPGRQRLPLGSSLVSPLRQGAS